MYPSLNRRNPNFPTPPRKSLPTDTFPNDLIAGGRNFYTEIGFVKYEVSQQLNSRNRLAIPAGSIKLPIPKKLNDVTTLSWGEISATSLGAGLLGTAAQALGGRVVSQAAGIISQAGAAAATVGSIAYGITVNPFLFMMFKQPNYKEHTLQWTLAPSNEEESQKLKTIINRLKGSSLPVNQGLYLQYPLIALVKIWPNDVFGNLIFKPCAVTSVSVDYTAAGPSFFAGSAAPTIVSLSIGLKEIQFWDRNDFEETRSSTFNAPIFGGIGDVLQAFNPNQPVAPAGNGDSFINYPQTTYDGR